MDIGQLATDIHQTARSKGFWDNDRNVGELLMLCVSELGEAMEAHRKGKFANTVALNDTVDASAFNTLFQTTVKDTFEDEIADAIIRLLDLSKGLNIDIETHIRLKMKYNEGRERLHGKMY